MLVYQICAGVATVAFVVLVIHAVCFLMQARETAVAVELLVLNANEQVERTSKVFEMVESLSNNITGTWGKLFAGLFALAKLKKK